LRRLEEETVRAVIQRAARAEIVVDGRSVANIGRGIVTLLGIHAGDTEAQLLKLLTKIRDLRVFEDPAGKMNLGLQEVAGEHLLISQFTLAGDCSSGRRPSFTTAEKPERARELFERAVVLSRELGMKTSSGVFQADMQVSLVNDGPVTFVLES
jgi:D-tyrosyl-tRNA(Tyr) deacylase